MTTVQFTLPDQLALDAQCAGLLNLKTAVTRRHERETRINEGELKGLAEPRVG